MQGTLTRPSLQPCADTPSTAASVIEEWIPKLAINAGAALDARTQAVFRLIWIEGLGDLPPDVLRAAFLQTLRECAYWPVKVADIRKHVIGADSTLANLEGENAWQKSLALAHDFGCDYSIASARESEDAALNAALRAAGGCRWLATCTDEQLSWAKKIFLEVYAKHRALPEMAPFCSHKDSPVLREVIEALAQQKSIPPCERPPESQIADDNSGAEELREVWSQSRREVEVLAKEKSMPRNPAIVIPQFTAAEIFEQKQVLDRYYASLSSSVPRSDLEAAAIETSTAKRQIPKAPRSQQEIMDGGAATR